jgi:surface antigen Omp85-like protein
VVRRRFPNLLILPVLHREDELGLTYGARLTVPEPRLFGKDSRITFPLTWGGTREAGIDVEKRTTRGPFDRITFGGSLLQQTDPAFDQDDTRGRLFLRGEREVVHRVRLGAFGGWQHVSFDGTGDRFSEIGGDVIVDTRVDPVLARNAVYGRASFTHLSFADHDPSQSPTPGRYAGYSGPLNRVSLDGRGYLGLMKQIVLAGRVQRMDADRPQPPYLQPELGGLGTLRGFPGGYAVGDTLVAMSAELVIPLNSPLKIAKFGVTPFFDRGTAYNKGESFADQTLLDGYGVSVWFAAALFRVNVAVAHGRGASTRIHVGGNVTF